MSTRGVYTFKGFGETHHVYKHFDNYLSGAADALNKTLPLAWELPRYEPDEFAASFVAANKDKPGGVRLMRKRREACDVEYGYTVYPAKNGMLMIDVSACDFWERDGHVPGETTIWKGSLLEFLINVQQIENEYYEID